MCIRDSVCSLVVDPTQLGMIDVELFKEIVDEVDERFYKFFLTCLLYTSPSPRDS